MVCFSWGYFHSLYDVLERSSNGSGVTGQVFPGGKSPHNWPVNYDTGIKTLKWWAIQLATL